MPPATLWSGNSDSIYTVSEGNVAYNDSSTTYDQNIFYDGTAAVNLDMQYNGNATLWSTPSPES